MPTERKSTYTPSGVLCFADGLFKPRPAAQGGKPRYSAILLFNQQSLDTKAYQDLRSACALAIQEKFGAEKAANPAFVRTLRLPFRNAHDKQYEGFENGEIYINPWLSEDDGPPRVMNLISNQQLPKEQVWSGQMARMAVHAFAYENSGNRGVAFGLDGVQIVKSDMKRLDGRRSASDAFKDADNTELEALLGIKIEDLKAQGLNAPGVLPSLDDMPF